MSRKTIARKVGYIPPGFEGKPATNHYSLDPGLVLLNNQTLSMLRFFVLRLNIKMREEV